MQSAQTSVDIVGVTKICELQRRNAVIQHVSVDAEVLGTKTVLHVPTSRTMVFAGLIVQLVLTRSVHAILGSVVNGD